MGNYLVRRLFWLIPTIFLMTVSLYLALRLMPGDYVDSLVQRLQQQNPLATVDKAALEKQLGLDRPIYEQYFQWMKGVLLHGELGISLISGESTTKEMLARMPITLELNLLATIIIWGIALPLGIYSGLRQDTWLDYLGRGFTLLSMGVPEFWIASVIIVYAGKWFGWFPEVVYIPFFQNPIGNLKQFIVPAMVMGLGSGVMMRTIRALVLEVIRQDYIRTAWAKGLTERIVVIRHGLKNAMIPLNNMIIPSILGLLGGSVMMENIFALPGMGRYLINQLTARDYPAILGTSLFFTTLGLITIVIVDISYAWADPRIRYR